MAAGLRVSIGIGIAVSCPLVSGSGLAKYPEKSGTVIAPFPAGGDTDFIARTLTEAARKRLKGEKIFIFYAQKAESIAPDSTAGSYARK